MKKAWFWIKAIVGKIRVSAGSKVKFYGQFHGQLLIYIEITVTPLGRKMLLGIVVISETNVLTKIRTDYIGNNS